MSGRPFFLSRFLNSRFFRNRLLLHVDLFFCLQVFFLNLRRLLDRLHSFNRLNRFGLDLFLFLDLLLSEAEETALLRLFFLILFLSKSEKSHTLLLIYSVLFFPAWQA